jgi:hypothetical protein
LLVIFATLIMHTCVTSASGGTEDGYSTVLLSLWGHGCVCECDCKSSEDISVWMCQGSCVYLGPSVHIFTTSAMFRALAHCWCHVRLFTECVMSILIL